MPTPFRLPVPNSDDGVWGDELVQWLTKEHYDNPSHVDDSTNNGGHQKITIRAGTATAGTAPLKFTSGTLLGSPEAGAVEFNTDSLYYTDTSGPTRRKIAAYDDSGSAQGDLYYRDSSGYFVKLALGTGNQVLSVNGSVPGWRQVIFATTSKSADYTITSSDTVIFADCTSGNVIITLPTASTVSGYRFYIKRTDGSANTVSVARSGSDTIDGATSQSLTAQYTSVTVVSDGSTHWYII